MKWLVLLLVVLLARVAFGQVDPEKRQLIQLGYNQALKGHGPFAGYAYYYRNDPGFFRTNITLRLAVAPVYLDGELAFLNALGEGTDLAFGAAGGGFANSYFEIKDGKYQQDQSFTGHGAEFSSSIYHRFNPGCRIPFNGIVRLSPVYAVYERDDKTSPNFDLPQDHAGLNLRTGLRLGGREPIILPDVAMELSGWYEGQFRDKSGPYGFNGDREMKAGSHLFWSRALFAYTLPKCKHNINLSVTAGTSIDSDRFSAYRLGGDLPQSSEFPLILPGYFYQEISASDFVNFTAQYVMPLDVDKRWSLTGLGSVASVKYVSGLSQPGTTHSGAGLGVSYRSPTDTWKVMVNYAYGFDAIRSNGRGGQSIGILCQIDLEARRRTEPLLDETAPYKSRGLFEFFRGSVF